MGQMARGSGGFVGKYDGAAGAERTMGQMARGSGGFVGKYDGAAGFRFRGR